MKKLLVFTIALILIFSLVACGQPESGGSEGSNTGTSQESGEMQGYSGNDGASLKDVSEKNYVKVAQSLFGVDLTPEEGWTVKEVKSYNGVNDLNVKFTIPEATNSKEVIKTYFEKTLKLTGGNIYAQDINWDTMSVSKGESYDDFESFSSAEVTTIDNFSSAMWIYDFDSKSVQFSVTAEAPTVELSITLLG